MRAFALLVALSITTASCVGDAPPPTPLPGDIVDGPSLARDAAQILLTFSAYDYAYAGSLAGERTRVVTGDRLATVARDQLGPLDLFRSRAVKVTAPARGPVRDRVVALADALADLGRDAAGFDPTDGGTFAMVIADVGAGWPKLRDLASVLPADAALAARITRGSAMVVSVAPRKVYALTVGPFSTQAEAADAVRRIGKVESTTRTAPFVVRIGTFPSRQAADAAATTLSSQFGVSLVTEEQRYDFTRSGPSPDAELWREPARILDTPGSARRVAVSSDGAWLLTGSDDGTVALFQTSNGNLRALPKLLAGVAYVGFSDDAGTFIAGGQSLTVFHVPTGNQFGATLRLPSVEQQVVFVPTARAWAAVSKGPTGQAAGGGGMVGARAPDGVVIGAPFPITTPSAGGAIAATDQGELYIATTTAGVTDIELLKVGAERFVRGVLKVPGAVIALAVDRSGTRAAVMTDRAVYRFGPRDTDPARTLTQIAPSVRDMAFGPDATLYLLEATKLTAIARDGTTSWTAPLIDGRRLVGAVRPIVLDGADRLIAYTADGTADELGTGGGVIQDVVTSPDGKRIGVLTEGRRAVLFTLP